MPLIAETLIKSPDAARTYWFVKPDCGEFQAVSSFSKITNNGNLLFVSADINTAILTDCDGNTYAIGKVIMCRLSGGEINTNETCKVVYSTVSGETDSFMFNVKLEE